MKSFLCYPTALDCIIEKRDVPAALYLEQAARFGQRDAAEIKGYLRRLALHATGVSVVDESVFCATTYTKNENPFNDEVPDTLRPQLRHAYLADMIKRGLDGRFAELYIGLDNALRLGQKVLVEVSQGHVAGIQQTDEDQYVLWTSVEGEVRHSEPYSLDKIAGTEMIDYGFDNIIYDNAIEGQLPLPWVEICAGIIAPTFTIFPAEA